MAPMKRAKRAATLAVVCWLSACGDEPADPPPCRQLEVKADLCGLTSIPDFETCDDVALSEGQRCRIKCRLNASCGELANSDFRVETLDCENDCGFDASQFVCDDGTRVPADWRCDGRLDCPDDSDEAGCADSGGSTFVCDDGTSIPTTWRCDGRPDCPDDSDEAGCPGAIDGGAIDGG